MTEGKKALLVMGCPEVPVQISMVIYLAHKLGIAGWDVTVAGTDAAVKLLKAADPESYYVQKTVDVDQLIEARSWKRRSTSTSVSPSCIAMPA